MDKELAQVEIHNTFIDFTGRYTQISGTHIETDKSRRCAHDYVYNVEIYI